MKGTNKLSFDNEESFGADGCSTHWQAFAKPEPILKSDPIYLEK